VTLNADGSFNYTPPSAVFTGADSFDYTATNGSGSDVGTVNITVFDKVFINEILFNPRAPMLKRVHRTRGPASAAYSGGHLTWLLLRVIAAATPGDVQTIINLSGLTFGSNGFLVLLQNGNTYTPRQARCCHQHNYRFWWIARRHILCRWRGHRHRR